MAGKVGLVTAAGSGMGRAGSVRFGKEGASVVVVDRDDAAAKATVDEVENAGGKAFAIVGDLRDRAFAASVAERGAEHFGRLDFLWNHVGIPGPSQFEQLDMDLYDETVDLNIHSGLCTTKAAVPHLRKQGGAILFTASTSALMGSPMSPVYSMTKAGVIGLVHGLARRLGPDGIRVNAVAPGAVDTPMLDVFFARPDDPRKLTADDAREAVKRRHQSYPLGRIATADDVANAALFLLSDEAAFITGTTLVVDGGLTC
jgi:NAD(P)-dependent dehydrogenase (short-subunit alcohol dehydrogenase family)